MFTIPSTSPASGASSPRSIRRTNDTTDNHQDSTPGRLPVTQDSINISNPPRTETTKNPPQNGLTHAEKLFQTPALQFLHSLSNKKTALPITSTPDSKPSAHNRSPKASSADNTSLATLQLDGKPHIRAFRDHISEGLKLIREEKYEEAIDHFSDKKALKKIGYYLGRGECIFRFKIPTCPEALKQLVDHYATKSMCKSDQKTLNMARIAFAPHNDMYGILKPENSAEEAALQQIRHEEALVHAEENLHALQDVLGHNITYFDTANEEHYEIDIATTLAAENVPMTPNFLQRYGREEHV